MTYNPNIPDANQSPDMFPAQGSTNFTRLSTIINAEHVFNNAAGVTDGVHRQSTYISRADPTVLPAGTNGMMYFGGNRAKGFDGINTWFVCPILAQVAFNNTGAVQGTSINLNTVVRNGVGDFTINFVNNLPNLNGQPRVVAYSGSVTTLLVGAPTDYHQGFVRILVKNAATGATVDPQLCWVTVEYGAT